MVFWRGGYSPGRQLDGRGASISVLHIQESRTHQLKPVFRRDGRGRRLDGRVVAVAIICRQKIAGHQCVVIYRRDGVRRPVDADGTVGR